MFTLATDNGILSISRTSMAYAGPDKRKSSETTFGKVTVSYFKQNEYVAGDSMTSTLTIAIDTETD